LSQHDTNMDMEMSGDI